MFFIDDCHEIVFKLERPAIKKPVSFADRFICFVINKLQLQFFQNGRRNAFFIDQQIGGFQHHKCF